MTTNIGSIVHYTLSANDVERIAAARLDGARYGNTPQEGDVVPLIVGRSGKDDIVSGQAFLDGNDSLAVTSANRGEGPGAWTWPCQ